MDLVRRKTEHAPSIYIIILWVLAITSTSEFFSVENSFPSFNFFFMTFSKTFKNWNFWDDLGTFGNFRTIFRFAGTWRRKWGLNLGLIRYLFQFQFIFLCQLALISICILYHLIPTDFPLAQLTNSSWRLSKPHTEPHTVYVGPVCPAGVCWNSTRFFVGWAVATDASIWKLVLQPAAGHTRPTYTVCGLFLSPRNTVFL
jgi:hypothetical protein